MQSPNCKNGCSTYYEGINQPPKEPTKEEVEEMTRRYNLEQRQRECERNIRKYKRLENGSLDADNIAKYAEKRRQWTNEYNRLIANNADVLRANPARLKLYGINSNDLKPAINATSKAGSIRNYSGDLAKGFGKTHYDALHDIIDNSNNTNLKAVWDKYENELMVGDAHKKGGAYAMGKSLYLDIDKCAKGNSFDKPYQVVFHEAGHGVDSACRKLVNESGVFASHFSGAYKGGVFPQTIKDEVMELVNSYDKKLKQEYKARGEKYYKVYAYKALENEIRSYNSYARANLSDILEGATNGKVQCGYGHGAKYWKDRTIGGISDGLATEAFAEMTDSTMSNKESLELIKKYLPKSYKIYEKMLEVMLNG